MSNESPQSKEATPVVLRRGSIADSDSFKEIQESVAHEKTFSASLGDEKIQKILKGSIVYFVEENKAPIGLISLKELKTGALYIDDLIITPPFQGKGVGKKVMLTMLDLFPTVREFELFTHPENKPARTLYESLGFIVEKQVENRFGDGEPRILMRLKRS